MKHARIMAIVLCLILVFSMAGCGSKTDDSAATLTPTGGQDKTPNNEEDNNENPTAGQEEKKPHLSKNGIETTDNGVVRKELTSLEMIDLMGNGINLGNTLEAYGRKGNGVGADTIAYETFWGQPVTTLEMITAMHEAGFDSLRIPIAWTNAMKYEEGDYTIGENYLNRVEEVINYALANDMYVVINDHWDGGWWGRFGSASEETRIAAMEQYISMWTQIAERYAEYSDHLIFESGNEELGDRLNDKDVCPDSGTLNKDDCYRVTNELNQAFVDTVRKTGGNNADRFLLIAGYNTDIQMTCDDRFQMPKDTANSKLLLSVHYYTPWGYTGTAATPDWGIVRDYDEQNKLLQMMTKFTEQGIGVVIGEYAVALNDKKEVKNNTDTFIRNLLNNSDAYGYCPMLWDCSSLFLRRTISWRPGAEAVAALYKERSNEARKDMTKEEIVKAAKEEMAAEYEAAEVTFDEDAILPTEDTAVAWIMFSSADWNLTYSVGDEYKPSDKSDGITVQNVVVENDTDTYTVSIDFTKTARGFANQIGFAALGIYNGEKLFPNHCIDIKEVKINGEPYELVAKPYTSSDDKKCTRVNLYNGYINSAPGGGRTPDGNTDGISPHILDPKAIGKVTSIEITFTFIALD